MGRIYQQAHILRDENGEPVIGPDGKRKKVVRSSKWWISYYDASGKRHYESTGSTKIGDAKRLLKQREGKVANGESVAPYLERLTFDTAMQSVVDDQKLRDRRSVDDTNRRIRLHLTPYFGGRLMMNIMSDDITAYAVVRKDAGAKPATINRELSIIKRAFRLGLRSRKLMSTPYIQMLDESDNVRRDFWTRPEFEAVRGRMPTHLRGLLTFYFWSGWRRGEPLNLEVRQVRIDDGVLELDGAHSKNKRGRLFDFSGITEVCKVLRAQLESAERLSREHGLIVTRVFHEPDGSPVLLSRFRKAWEQARDDAGYPTKTIHGFRRTAVRNLVRAGVPDTVAMQITGHKTRSIFSRYDITSHDDLRQAGEQVNAFVTGGGAATPKQPMGKIRQFKRRAVNR